MAIRTKPATTPLGKVLRQLQAEWGGVTYARIAKMLQADRVRMSNWVNGRHQMGHPYSMRLALLQLKRQQEIKQGVGLADSFIYDKAINWPNFWDDFEQVELAAQ